MATNKHKVEESTSWEDKYAMTGFFNVSSMAKQRVEDKRKKKGLSDNKPREKNVYGQIFIYGSSYTLARTLVAPLERIRIIQQTSHMQNLKGNVNFTSFRQVFASNPLPLSNKVHRNQKRPRVSEAVERKQSRVIQNMDTDGIEGVHLR